MATGSAAVAYHGTLTIDTVDAITLTLNHRWVTVYNRAATGDIFVTTNNVDPTLAGADTYVVPAAQNVLIPVSYPPNEPALSVANTPVVKLICHTANAYSVVGQ